jgi:uncharacterized membrane protein
MTSDNALAAKMAREPTIFSAVITPHRSLGRTGFVVLMSIVAGVSFVAGMVFLMLGAWPVFGVFGLDAVLIWWAFRVNYRAAGAYEEVTVTASALTVRQVSHRGKVHEYSLNPCWVRLDREAVEDYGIAQLFLVVRDRRLPVGGFLGPREKESFALALGAALGEARRGPTRTVFE